MENVLEIGKADCPYCGAPLALEPGVDQLQCAYCGSQLLVQRHDGFPGQTPALYVQQSLSGERCPKCGRADTVAKASALATGGSSGAQAQGPLPAGQSKLALQLAFPGVGPNPTPQPGGSAPGCRIASIVISLVAAGAADAIFAKMLPGAGPLAAGIVFGVVLAVALILFMRAMRPSQAPPEIKRRDRDEKTARMKKIYQRVCYCSHCSVIWLEGRQSVYDPGELAVLLHGVPQQ